MKTLTRGAFANPGTTTGFKTGTWREQKPIYVHNAAPCHSACPAGEDAQAYIAQVQSGELRAAWETLVNANPLPAITGRVCYHPCENACHRGRYDEPIAIHSIERYLGDQAIENQWVYPVKALPEDATRVAVVGAGPAGISAAYHLLRLGYAITLFGDLSEPGGTLHYIPEYRLPRDVLNNETGRVLNLPGIDYRPQTRLGRDVYLDDLHEEYAAVFLGIGTHRSRDWEVGGATPTDLHQGLDVLKEWMAIGTVPEAESVVVVGGGNTAVDLARILKRAGIPEVHIVTHNGLPGPDVATYDSMRAIPREVDQALEEGVQIHAHRGIRRLILRGEKVVGIEMVHMKKLRNKEDELVRTAFEGTETVLHVDQVIPAIGQRIDAVGLGVLANGNNYLPVDYWGKVANQNGVFSGGDAAGHGTVTEAIGDGRRAALAIDRWLQNQNPLPKQGPSVVPFENLNLHYVEQAPRSHQPILPAIDRTADAEVESGLDTKAFAAEAKRCFSCGNCMACDNCFTLCPDSAVLKLAESGTDDHYVFDYDFCKGCGLCANECPCGYIEMVPEK